MSDAAATAAATTPEQPSLPVPASPFSPTCPLTAAQEDLVIACYQGCPFLVAHALAALGVPKAFDEPNPRHANAGHPGIAKKEAEFLERLEDPLTGGSSPTFFDYLGEPPLFSRDPARVAAARAEQGDSDNDNDSDSMFLSALFGTEGLTLPAGIADVAPVMGWDVLFMAYVTYFHRTRDTGLHPVLFAAAVGACLAPSPGVTPSLGHQMALDLLLTVGAAAPMPRYLWHDIMTVVWSATRGEQAVTVVSTANVLIAALALWGVFQGWALPVQTYMNLHTLVTVVDSVALKLLLATAVPAATTYNPLTEAMLLAPVTGTPAGGGGGGGGSGTSAAPKHSPARVSLHGRDKAAAAAASAAAAAEPEAPLTPDKVRRDWMWNLLSTSGLRDMLGTIAVLQGVAPALLRTCFGTASAAKELSITYALRVVQASLHTWVHPIPKDFVLARPRAVVAEESKRAKYDAEAKSLAAMMAEAEGAV